MNVLVCGGAGYIGSNMTELLTRAGHKPIVYDNLSKGHASAIKDANFIKGDLADYDLLVKTLKAENGIKALEILDKEKYVDLVLMDIMMPVMDGYETMKKIRAKSRFGKLPIIALTAKAMQRDKEDCIAAGANDYLAKPVEIDRLLSMMRVWLYR